MRLIIGFLLLLGVAAPAAAGFVVHDGDTFKLMVPAPRGDAAGGGWVRFRPLGYDAAERGEPCLAGQAMDRLATEALRALLRPGAVAVRTTGRASFDRELAEVTIDGVPLAEIMVGRGLGRPWRRGLPGWCE